MHYVVFPESEYTYTPHILSSFIIQNLAAQNQSNQTNQITLLIQSVRNASNLFYYKDARWRDDYTKRRLTKLIQPENLPNRANVLHDTDFECIRCIDYKEKGRNHSYGLIYTIQYEINYQTNKGILLNALIHESDTISFLEHARQFAAKHDTEPLLFHDAIGRDWDSRFDNLARHLAETGYSTFLTFQPFRKKLMETPHFSKCDVRNSIGYFDLYKLS